MDWSVYYNELMAQKHGFDNVKEYFEYLEGNYE